MSAATLLGRLRLLGATAQVRPDGGLAIAPASVVPPDLLEELRAAKAELLRLLAEPAGPAVPCDDNGPLVPCPACGYGQWWRLSVIDPAGPGLWTCGRCHPYPPDRVARWIDGCAVPPTAAAACGARKDPGHGCATCHPPDHLPPEDVRTAGVRGPPTPDPAEIERRAEALMLLAVSNPACRITNVEKARSYFRSEAIREWKQRNQG